MTDSAAHRFRTLHKSAEILVLPNAWDAASAAMMADAGAKAVATSSASVAWAHGYPDGDALPVEVLLGAAAEIVRVIDVPLAVDFEGGYTEDLSVLADHIRRLIATGAVGINLEDGHRAPDVHVRKIEAVRGAAETAGVALFINARTDVYLAGLAEGAAAYAETVRRAELYRSAGADGIFVPGLIDDDLIGRLASAIRLPLNVMGRGGISSAARLQALGARRLSSGTAPFRTAYAALARGLEVFLRDGDADGLAKLGAGAPDLNGRFAK